MEPITSLIVGVQEIMLPSKLLFHQGVSKYFQCPLEDSHPHTLSLNTPCRLLEHTRSNLNIAKIMAAATINHSSFPQFSALAPELRNQIWADALPDIGPALYSYRKGCWCPRRLSKSDAEYDPENEEHNLSFQFRHDLLDDVQFEMPLLLVNQEARSIASAWIRAQGTKIRPCRDREYPVFIRLFDPMRDALYIPLEKWDDFLREPYDRQSEPDLLDKLLDCRSDMIRIAVPEALIRNEGETLPEIFQWSFNLRQLLIVADTQPELRSMDNDLKVQRPWEFESTQGGVFFWDNKRGSFDLRESKNIGDEALHRLLEGSINNIIGQGLIDNRICSFEIRPVIAIKS